MIVTLALCVCLVRCEPPALSSQYGVPGNFAGPQGGYQQQQQQQGGVGYQTGVTNSYGAPLGGDGGGGGHGGHGGHGNGHDEQQDYIDNQVRRETELYNIARWLLQFWEVKVECYI